MSLVSTQGRCGNVPAYELRCSNSVQRQCNLLAAVLEKIKHLTFFDLP